MEVFGGFMVMLSILGFFLAVLWFVLPFVVFAIKGKLDHATELLEAVDRRLEEIEKRLPPLHLVTEEHAPQATGPDTPPSGSSPPSVEA